MANQTGKGVGVYYKAQTTLGTPPGGTGGTQLRMTGGGLSLAKAYIQSREIRPDQQSSIGRHGSRSVTGGYDMEWSLGSFNDWMEAAMRTTWTTAFSVTNATVAGATLSAITCGTNTVTSDGGSWITAGITVGDIFRITNYSTTANNSINLRVKTVTTNTITVHGTAVLTSGSSDTAFTISVLRKLVRAATPTERTFYIEENYQNIDQSAVFDWAKIISMQVQGTPDGMATGRFNVLAVNEDTLATGSSPYNSSPTTYTSAPLVFADAKISYNGTDVAVVTAFDFTYQTVAAVQPVVGSQVSPDVFANDSTLTGSISFIRTNLDIVDQFTDETQVEIHVMLTENESEPKDCLAFYIPACKLSGVNAPLGGDGAMIETCSFTAGMKEGYTATGYEDTMLKIVSSV